MIRPVKITRKAPDGPDAAWRIWCEEDGPDEELLTPEQLVSLYHDLEYDPMIHERRNPLEELQAGFDPRRESWE